MISTCEWNIDLASENLGSGRDEHVSSNEIGESEMAYCNELSYMYEPDVLDTLPPATTALYGSDTETGGIQGQLQKFPTLLSEETNAEIKCEWPEQDPVSESNDSVDSSYESQVSTPQASPRRCEEEDAQPTTIRRKAMKTKIEKEVKERKRESRQTEPRGKQQRLTKAQAALAREAKEATPELPPRNSGSRPRSVSPTPDEDDDPQGLFSRDPSTLTPEEIKLLKKRKRLIKNRESAQLSRQRKRIRLETLQAEVLHLEEEKKALAARVDQLVEENAALKRKLLGGGANGGGGGKTRSSAAATAH